MVIHFSCEGNNHMETILGFLALIGLGIFGWARNQKIKREEPEKANFVNETWQDAPAGMRVSGYEDKTANQYYHGKVYIAWAIIAFIALLYVLFSSK